MNVADVLKNLFKGNELICPDSPDERARYTEYLDEVADMVRDSFARQYVSDRVSTPLRISSLGKTCPFELLGKKLGLLSMGGTHSVSESLKLVFTVGDFFETYFQYLLRRANLPFKSQDTVYWEGVSGHYDYIVDFGEGDVLLELKSCNEYYFNSVKRDGVDDARGYLTQLCLYQEALGIPAYWVFWNKNRATPEVFALDSVPEEIRKEKKEHARRTIEVYNKCESQSDLYRLTQPPPPIQLTVRGHKYTDDDGKPILVPNPVVSFPTFCYQLESMKVGRYYRKVVKDYNYPVEFQEVKPDMWEDWECYSS